MIFKWSAYPFVRIAVSLIFGVLLFQLYPTFWAFSYWITIPSIFLLLFFTAFRDLRGVIILIILIYLGGWITKLDTPGENPLHYAQYDQPEYFTAIIVSDQMEKARYSRFEAAVRFIKADSASQAVEGKIHLYVQKSDKPNLRYGDIVGIRNGYFEVSGPNNPDEFNYKRYLERQHIYAQVFIDEEEVVVLGYDPPNMLVALANNIRNECRLMLERFIEFDRERAILTALLLGIKDHLNDETLSVYESAGAMHVLAVSGLHVGIVYMILNLLFGRLRGLKMGKTAFLAVTLASIWMYALITGFSPSVMRAATMFSIIAISDTISRRTNIYNSLGIAATLLILYDPLIIYAVGFQLSFAAVLGIVALYPILYRMLEVDSRIGDYVWSITCVSLAAQLATFPLSILYFHKFPVYFLVSNLLVIPAAFVLLTSGVTMLAIGSVLPVIATWVGNGVERFLWLINELLFYVRVLPYPSLEWLYFDQWDVTLIYAALATFFLAILRYQFTYLVFSSLMLMMFLGWSFYKEMNYRTQQRMVFYDTGKVSSIDLIAGERASLLIDTLESDLWERLVYQVNPHRLANGLPSVNVSDTLLKSHEAVLHREQYKLLLWKGEKVFIPMFDNDVTLTDTIHTDLVYFKNPEDMRSKVIAHQVILGEGFGYREVLDAKDKLKECCDNIHSLRYDGYWSTP